MDMNMGMDLDMDLHLHLYCTHKYKRLWAAGIAAGFYLSTGAGIYLSTVTSRCTIRQRTNSNKRYLSIYLDLDLYLYLDLSHTRTSCGLSLWALEQATTKAAINVK